MNNRRIIKQLEAGRARVSRGWSQGAMARDAFGQECPPHVRRANTFCVRGAMMIRAGNDTRKACNLLEIATKDVGEGLATWNDTSGRKQAEVVALYDEAIRVAYGMMQL